MQRVLEETVGSPVAPHLDEGDHVEKDARPFARGERQIEQVDARRRLPHDGFELALEQREAPDLDLAQLRDRLGALGVLDPRAPDRGGEIGLRRLRNSGFSSIASVPKPFGWGALAALEPGALNGGGEIEIGRLRNLGLLVHRVDPKFLTPRRRDSCPSWIAPPSSPIVASTSNCLQRRPQASFGAVNAGAAHRH